MYLITLNILNQIINYKVVYLTPSNCALKCSSMNFPHVKLDRIKT